MYVLGIETSCDETSLSVVNKRRVLSNTVWSSLNLHAEFGGVIPEIASRQHLKSLSFVFSRSLEKAGIGKKKIDLISVVSSPGLIGSLLVGINFARALGYALGLPVIEIDHLKAHLFAAFLNNRSRINVPSLGLVVSGGHTELYWMQGFENVRVLGRTRDDAAGEALDKVGRLYGLGYPAGPLIDKLFDLSLVNKRLFEIKGLRHTLDFSFSGIKTKAGYMYKQRNGRFSKEEKIGILSSFQYGIVSHIIEKINSALSQYKVRRIICGGGVAANFFLRQSLIELCRRKKLRLFLPDIAYCSDNGSSAAGLGFYMYNMSKGLGNNNQ